MFEKLYNVIVYKLNICVESLVKKIPFFLMAGIQRMRKWENKIYVSRTLILQNAFFASKPSRARDKTRYPNKPSLA